MSQKRKTATLLKLEKFLELSTADLLKQPLKSLPVSLESSDLFPFVEQFKKELSQKNVPILPELYLGDEWFSPEGMNAIAIPFYLAHEHLKDLEYLMMLEVEGGEPLEFLKLLRHEAGHCFDHCFKFSKRKKWRKIFGSPDVDYKPETYRPQPYSKSFVKHLDRWYAQAHPDEDFAETFAVWLDPESNWQVVYKEWPVALEKLNYIEELVKESQSLKNQSELGRLPYNVKHLTLTLEKYYLKKKKEYADNYPDFYDVDLKKIFNGEPSLKKKEFSAARFMKRHRKEIVSTVTWATNEKKIIVDALVKRLITRVQNLNLKLGKTDLQTTMEVSSFLTSLVKNYLFTGQFKRAA